MPTEESTSATAEPATFYFFSNDGFTEDASHELCQNSQFLGSGRGRTMTEAFQNFLGCNPNEDYDFTEVWGIQVVGQANYSFTIPR